MQPKEFYRALFPAGSLQRAGVNRKENIIASQLRPKGKGKTRHWIVVDTLERLDKVIGDSFGLIPPISFLKEPHQGQRPGGNQGSYTEL